MVKKILNYIIIILILTVVFACASSERNARGLTTEQLSEDINVSVFPQLGHEGIIVAFSPDGKTVTSGSKDGTLKIWDAFNGREIRTLSGHEEEITAIAYSSDSKIIVSGSQDCFVIIWDAQTGKEIKTLDAHYRKISSVAYSPGGKYFVSGSWDNSLIKWDAITYEKIHTLDHFYSNSFLLTSIAFNPDGKTVLSVSADIKIWDTETGSELSSLITTSSAELAVYSPDGKYIVASYGDNAIRLWDVVSGEVIKAFTGHTDKINSIAFSPDGNYIVTSSKDMTIKIFNIENGNAADFKTDQSVTSLAYSPDGFSIATASGNIKLLDANNCNEIISFTGKSGTGSRVYFAPDGKTILSRSNLWDIETGREIRRNAGSLFSPDGKITVDISRGTLTLRDAVNGNEINKFQCYNSPDFATIFSPDGNTVAACFMDSIRIWDITNGQEIISISDYPRIRNIFLSIAYSPDGKSIVSGHSNATIKLWDAASGEEIKSFIGHGNNVTSVAFHPDGSIIASGSGDSSIKLWEVNTGREIRTLTGHTGRMVGGVRSVAFSPDGKFLVSGSVDTTLKLWDVNTGREIKTFTGHLNNVSSVSFSFDGKQVVSASDDGTARLWDIATGQEIASFISFTGTDSQIATTSRGLTVETQTASSTIEGEWLSITPDGYYQASPRGDRYLNVRVNNTVSGIDAYRSIFYNPDVVQARLQGLPDPASKVTVTIQQAAAFMPPEISIQSPSSYASTNTGTANLSVAITDQNRPLESVRIFVNGRPAGSDELASVRGTGLQARRASLTVTGNQRTVSFTMNLDLDQGQNRIEVVAFNGYSENRRFVDVTYNAPAGLRQTLPNLWILAIGVNSYDNAGPRLGGMGNLNFAAADARRLIETFKSQEGTRYAQVNSLIIADGEALLPTTENIKRNFSFLDRAGDRDIVILFLAGHGLSAQEGKFFFLPKDAVVTGSAGSYRVDESRAVSGDDITAVLEGPGRRLLFIDACQSGGVDSNRMIRSMMESNAFVFAASQGNELSYESASWGGGHGVFTYSVLNALRGAPAALAEGNVSVLSMSGYVRLEVPRQTQNRQNPRLYSLLSADFPLASIR